MSDITKIKVADEPESNFKLYPRNSEFAKRADVQPDWNQNDVSAPDYVKNRTHWEDPEILDVIFQQDDVALYDATDFLQADQLLVLSEELVVGDTYNVNIDGVDHYVVCYTDQTGEVHLGKEWPDRFMIFGNGSSVGLYLFNFNYGSTVRLTVTHITPSKIHKLDPKYLPDTDVQPDWNQNDVSAPDYVKNRPFYAEDPVETVLLEERVVGFANGCSSQSFVFTVSSEDINHIKVTWDGTEYICIPQIHSDYIVFGNEFIDDDTCEDTGEPFYYDGDVFYTDSSADSHQIKVSKLSNEVIQIDPNYIPNSNIRNGLGWLSTEEGSGTTASSLCSHAEGSDTTASGLCSHAEGSGTTASGNYSHAEGWSATASGLCSHAEGYYTTASGEHSHVEGKYNIEDTANKYAHIIGNGTSASNRHNCFMVGWDGAIYVQASNDATKMMKLTIKSDGTISAEQVTV